MKTSAMVVRFAAVFVVASTLIVSACTTYEPLVSDDLVQEIADDGREWTYDVAWQNTRGLTLSIVDGELDQLSEQAIVLTARLHRLDTARAHNMADRRTAATITRLGDTVNSRSVAENMARLPLLAKDIEELFDEGDFAGAKQRALEVYVIARFFDNLE